jgi:hypothetical protein
MRAAVEWQSRHGEKGVTMHDRELAIRRRHADDRLTEYREGVRRALAAYVTELGGAQIVATSIGDREWHRQVSISLAEVRAAQRVLFMA